MQVNIPLLFLFLFFSTVYGNTSKHVCEQETALKKHLKPISIEHIESGLELIDCIYVINLDKRPDKWERVKGIFEGLGLKAHRVSGVNGWELSQETFRELCGPYPVRLLPGEYGCLLSHLSVLDDALKRGFEHIWVCEDDIDVLGDVKTLPLCVKKLTRFDPEWDLLFTDQRPRNVYHGQLSYVYPPRYIPRRNETLDHPADHTKITSLDNSLARIGYRTGTTSMIISKRGIKKMLDYFTHVYLFSQIDLDMHFIPGFREYVCKKDVVSNLVGSESDVLQKIDLSSPKN